MALLYLAAGLNHFWNKRFYLKIMPPWIPFHEAMVFISGVFEIVLALLLLFPQTRAFAAWGIILLLIAVFPANIQMTLNYWNRNDPKLWMTILRLPIQVLLIWWAYSLTAAPSQA